MFDRYNEEARNVVVLAQEEARALRHSYIGAEHLLLAVLRLPREAAVAPVRAGLGLTVGDQIRSAAATTIPAPNPKLVEARRRGRRVAMPNRRIGVDLSAEADRLLMSAGARALDDGRTLITISDLAEALRRWHDADDAPPESATG